MFSRRTGWNLAANLLAAALEARRRAGREILDLTVSNPTRAGIGYPSDAIARALSDPSAHDYDPDPRGSMAAREAIAQWYDGRGIRTDPGRIVLTASTSEAYAWLFKLLCDAGDRVLVPRPSYPLFEFLASLESVGVVPYPLHYERRWSIDRDALMREVASCPVSSPSGRQDADHPDREPVGPTPGLSFRAPEARFEWDAASGHVRALVLVNPNNPTGCYLSRSDHDFLGSLAQQHDLPLISDEVFSSYLLDTADTPKRRSERVPDGGDPSGVPAGGRSPDLLHTLIGDDDRPAFVLDGLSKSAGLPGMKIGWIVVQGPASFRSRALERLEVIADTFLSVGAPVQKALPGLIEIGREVSSAIRRRSRANLDALHGAIGEASSCEVLRVEGGWSAVLRVPRTRSEEEWCLELLEQDGVLVQPGWFFDFENEAYLIVSLLTPEPVFEDGITRILARAR